MSDSTSAASAPVRERGPSFPNLDAYRSLGMLMIMTTHVSYATGLQYRSIVGVVFARFDVGLPVFFMVSGFLLYRQYVMAVLRGDPQPSTRTFLKRRLLRIVPGYWFALIGIAIIFGLPLYQHGSKLLTNGNPSAWMWFLFLTLLHTFRSRTGFQGITQSWSIGVELGFYLLLPGFARLMRRWIRDSPTDTQVRRMLIVCAGLYAAGEAWRVGVVWAHPGWLQSAIFWFPSHLDFFAIGMGFAVLSAAHQLGRPLPRPIEYLGRRPWIAWLIALALFIVVVNPHGFENRVSSLFSIFNAPLTITKEYPARQFIYGIAGAFYLLPAVFGPQRDGLIRRFLSSKVLVWGGGISYGFYLWHLAFLGQAEKWTHAGFFRGPFVKMWLITLGLSLIAGTFSHYVVERPFLRLKAKAR